MQNQLNVNVIGVGANGEVFHRNLIEKAEVILGGKRILKFYDKIHVKKLPIGKNLKQTLIELKSSSYKNIVILASGDPLFFGIGKTILEIFPYENVNFFPYFNSVQLLCSKLKIPYEDVVNLSIHGREINLGYFIYKIKTNKKVAILTDRTNNINNLAIILCNFKYLNLKVFIGQMLGTLDEKIIETTPEKMKYIQPSDLDVVLIYNELPSQKIISGIDDSEFFHEKGLITKKEIRTVSISYLEIEENSILWDIGSGSGSVAIEASFLNPYGVIYAIEQKKERIEHIIKNVKKFKCHNIFPINGKAPEILEGLPPANRVFIGGNSGGIIPLLNYIHSTLSKGTIMVINLVSVDKLSEIINFCKNKKLHFNSSMIQICNLKDIADNYYYKTNNPVYIFKIRF